MGYSYLLHVIMTLQEASDLLLKLLKDGVDPNTYLMASLSGEEFVSVITFEKGHIYEDGEEYIPFDDITDLEKMPINSVCIELDV